MNLQQRRKLEKVSERMCRSKDRWRRLNLDESNSKRVVGEHATLLHVGRRDCWRFPVIELCVEQPSRHRRHHHPSQWRCGRRFARARSVPCTWHRLVQRRRSLARVPGDRALLLFISVINRSWFIVQANIASAAVTAHPARRCDGRASVQPASPRKMKI